MSVCRSLFAATLAGTFALAASPATSQTLPYANQGDLKSLDPYTLNESTTHAHLGHVYQGRHRKHPIYNDQHFLNVCRYVEANARRANLVPRAEEWGAKGRMLDWKQQLKTGKPPA